MGGRRIYQPRGKVLGGSSCINGMIWIRGNPLDYQRWAREPGLEDWDFAHCLPYFRRIRSAKHSNVSPVAADVAKRIVVGRLATITAGAAGLSSALER